MFCMYGPNTQAGHGGSLIFYLECQFRYIMDILKGMLNEGTGAAEVRKDLHDDYNRRVQEAHQKMIWTHPGISTYYNNSRVASW
ncbi:MAG: hypothetical protein IPF97_06275 [Sphingomonadales bacterium]|nr:hypothetical protein [Sphingomonadales bacterium]